MEQQLPQPPRPAIPSDTVAGLSGATSVAMDDAVQPPRSPAEAAENGAQAPQEASSSRNRKTRMGITDARRLQTRVNSLGAAYKRLKDDLVATTGEDPQGLKLKLQAATHQLDLAEQHLTNCEELVNDVHDTLDSL